jgi:hypothetical protein
MSALLRAAAEIEASMPLFCHQGGSLHYLVRGRGEALLLLHGLGASGADWAMQVRALEGQFRVDSAGPSWLWS